MGAWPGRANAEGQSTGLGIRNSASSPEGLAGWPSLPSARHSGIHCPDGQAGAGCEGVATWSPALRPGAECETSATSGEVSPDLTSPGKARAP